VDAGGEPLHAADDVIEELLLATQLLRTLLVVPDARILQVRRNFFQSGFLGLDVKDTSAVRPAAL
jgi:hypothetical protein